MKKILSLIIALVFVMSTFAVFPVFAAGTEYNVSTADELKAAISAINKIDSTNVVINLKADIVYNENWTSAELLTYASTGQVPSTKTEEPELFTPLGSVINASNSPAHPFMGTFNGNGYTISGLCVRRVKTETLTKTKDAQGAALAGFAKKSTIKNLTIDRSAFYAASGWVGAIIGNSYQGVNTVSGINIKDVKLKDAGNYTGGIIGANYYAGTSISNVNIDASVSGTGSVGGVVGHNTVNMSISNVNADVTVNGTSDYVGGIVGYTEGKMNISNVNAIATVNATSTAVGGIVGYNKAADTSVSDVTADIDVSGINNVGGIVGYIETKMSISNVNAIATVNATAEAAGGIVGYNNGDETEISNVNANVTINSASTAVGGIVGYNTTNELMISNIFVEGTVTSTYVDPNSKAKAYVGGVVGQNDSSGTLNLTNAVVDVDVTAQGYVGSFLGGGTSSAKSNITNCFARGNITATQQKAGGMVGCVNSAGATNLKNCAYIGEVKGNSEKGPVFGYNYNTSVTATACYGFKKDNTSASTAKLYGGCSSGTGSAAVTVTNHSNINCKTRDELAAIIDGWGKATTDTFTNSTDALGALFNNTVVGIQTGYENQFFTRAVRFIATVNDTDYQEVGFIIKMTRPTASGTESATVTRSTKNVYTSINSVTESTPASEFDSKYLIAIGVNQLDNVNELTFEVTSYVTTLGGITYITDVETIKYEKINGTIYINGKEEK